MQTYHSASSTTDTVHTSLAIRTLLTRNTVCEIEIARSVDAQGLLVTNISVVDHQNQVNSQGRNAFNFG
jgi:hypothetical protein